MKTGVFVGLFVLVACLQLQANGATFMGRTKDCKKEPEGLANVCHRFLCDENSGVYDVHTCGTFKVSCPDGQIADEGAEDLTKSYPDCCSRPSCRDA